MTRALAAFSCILALIAAGPAAAVPEFRELVVLGDSQTFLRIAPLGGQGTQTRTTGPASDNGGAEGELQGTRASGEAEAETGGDFAPYAFASISMQILEFGRAVPFAGAAEADFTYLIEVVPLGDQTPDSVDNFPIQLVGIVTASDGLGSFATASLSIDTIDGFNLLRKSTDEGDEAFDETIQMVRNQVYEVHLSATASAQVGIFTDSANASAFADPRIFFDQAAFDLLQAEAGLPTFDLEQYYGIGISQQVFVPEPGAALLALCGAIAWAGRRGLRG